MVNWNTNLLTRKFPFYFNQIKRSEFQSVTSGIFKAFFNHTLGAFLVLAEISSPGNVDCALACLRNETCLSFNFAILPHTISKLYTCQLLPIDKYWNPDRFALSHQFHHYAIPVGLVSKSPLAVVHFSVWRTKCPKRNTNLFYGQIYQATGKFSILTKLTFGIPQEQIHGPRLFVLHFNDLPNCFEDTTLWLFYDNTNISAVNKAIQEGEFDLHNDSRMRRNGSLSLNFNSFYFKSKRR